MEYGKKSTTIELDKIIKAFFDCLRAFDAVLKPLFRLISIGPAPTTFFFWTACAVQFDFHVSRHEIVRVYGV